MARLLYVRSETDLGNIEIVADFESGSYYMLVEAQASPSETRAALDIVHDLGLEPMDEDECPSELLASGACRVWLAQIGAPAWP